MKITQFTMEEVRCFSERQTLEIRPLTFLVGENSTGKTTALACFHVLANYLRREGVDFNSHPYSMGTFKDIVRNSRKKEKAFKLGFAYTYANENVELTVEFAEQKDWPEPTVRSLTVTLTDGEFIFKTGDSLGRGTRLTDFDEKGNRFRIVCEGDDLDRVFSYAFYRFFAEPTADFLEGHPDGQIALVKYAEERGNALTDIFRHGGAWNFPSLFSMSPIRSEPERTYNPIGAFGEPKGSDVPLLLMRTKATQKDNWEALKTQLIKFGKSSGLFHNIEIRNFERSLGSSFQLKVKVRGPSANIVDVGYGVSQILPILVRILNPEIPSETRTFYPGPTCFLLQQPEVHLHPRAQAEFTSLLVQLASTSDRSFIIETHSDYMIDRARIDIRKGHIRPEDVSLIYFEPMGNIVRVHNISFDKMANMMGVPPHYGEFFLKETDRLMGFED